MRPALLLPVAEKSSRLAWRLLLVWPAPSLRQTRPGAERPVREQRRARQQQAWIELLDEYQPVLQREQVQVLPRAPERR